MDAPHAESTAAFLHLPMRALLMPLKRGTSQKTISGNIAELHNGATYERTTKKYGKQKANKQAVAIAMRKAGKGRKRTIAEGY
jgi:hypothetical protein